MPAMTTTYKKEATCHVHIGLQTKKNGDGNLAKVGMPIFGVGEWGGDADSGV